MDISCYMGAITCDGFTGFYDELADMFDLEKMYILKGGSGIGKNTFIRRFADLYPNDKRVFIYCSNNPASLDGVILPDRRTGMIDGTNPHITDPKYPGLCEEIIDLGVYIDTAALGEKGVTREMVQRLNCDKAAAYKLAYECLGIARARHDKLEDLYAGCVDFAAMQKMFRRKFKQ